jgi:hypothetical protein
MPGAAMASIPKTIGTSETNSDAWDVSWADKLASKRAAVFDCTEVESGSGVWRAHVWTDQMVDVLKAKPADVVPVIVLRHNAIILAMQQSFWDKYNIGEAKKVTDPMTDKPTKKNPVLVDEKDPAQAASSAAGLQQQISRGAVALACNMAFAECVSTVESHEKLSPEAARKVAISYVVPGVILQPSGVFATIHAQAAGAHYIKAS